MNWFYLTVAILTEVIATCTEIHQWIYSGDAYYGCNRQLSALFLFSFPDLEHNSCQCGLRHLVRCRHGACHFVRVENLWAVFGYSSSFRLDSDRCWSYFTQRFFSFRRALTDIHANMISVSKILVILFARICN